MGLSHNDYAYIERLLRYIMTPLVKLNILGNDKGSNFKLAHLIYAPVYEDGLLSWKYDENLLPILRDLKVFTILSLLVVRDFESKYELALYKFFIVCLFPNLTEVKISTSLDILRDKILLLEPENYPDFKILHRDILKKYVNKVREKCSLEVTYTFKREQRKVVGIDWVIRDKGTKTGLVQKKVRDYQEPKTFKGALQEFSDNPQNSVIEAELPIILNSKLTKALAEISFTYKCLEAQ